MRVSLISRGSETLLIYTGVEVNEVRIAVTQY